jgi:hypothetical protein
LAYPLCAAARGELNISPRNNTLLALWRGAKLSGEQYY